MECSERLRRIVDYEEADAEQRSLELNAMVATVKSGEFRDEAFTPELYKSLFDLIVASFLWRSGKASGDIVCAQQIFWGATQCPEFDVAVAGDQLKNDFVWAVTSRTDGTALKDEWPFLRNVIAWVYEHFPARRSELRGLIGRTLKQFGRLSHRGVPIGPLLEVVGPIIRGFQSPLTRAHKSLLLDLLLPLHRPNEWAVWDRQMPLVGLYHKELVHCIVLFLDKEPPLAVKCVEVVCTHFPTARESNTPKEVLLLYELTRIMKYLGPDDFRQILPTLLRQLVRVLGSQNAQPLQSVLQFWKDDHFVELCSGASQQIIPQLLPSLLRGGEIFWNPTVNRMTSLVLEKLESSNAALFAEVAEDLWGPGRQVPLYEVADERAVEAAAVEEAGVGAEDEEAQRGQDRWGPDVSSLKFRMGGWVPPKGGAAAAGGSRAPPPLTVTGVAPWAMKGGPSAHRPGPLVSAGAHMAAGAKPPVTVTGVAPWAFQKQPKAPGLLTAASRPGPPRQAVPPTLGSFAEQDEEVAEVPRERSGLERIREYMRRLVPDGESASGGGPTPWEEALQAETPTLLPTLKFHQLVFGHTDLGSGAFSVVRYARTIVKDKTQSKWPEYAVKVINTKTMEELGYEACVNREICVLSMLSHPNIARMVTSFRYRDGAYLVLEYASKGDLHSLLVRQGALDEATARFFLGETIAALCAIHDIGFMYGDLKPENVVITATGHAKLADFGGCRPITPEARAKTQDSFLRRLRDGHWRAQDQHADVVEEEDPDRKLAAFSEDLRIEGTTMYLPPEVVRGGAPSLAADAWALGCMSYQLLTGKPPFWVESELEEEVRSRIVTFRIEDGLAEMSALAAGAQSFVGALLEVDVARRLPVAATAAHLFFEGVDVFALHQKPRGPEIARAAQAAPAGDERWQKRQYSKIWTVIPDPQDYAPPDVSSSRQGASAALVAETAAERDAAFGDEGVLEGVEGPAGAAAFARSDVVTVSL